MQRHVNDKTVFAGGTPQIFELAILSQCQPRARQTDRQNDRHKRGRKQYPTCYCKRSSENCRFLTCRCIFLVNKVYKFFLQKRPFDKQTVVALWKLVHRTYCVEVNVNL